MRDFQAVTFIKSLVGFEQEAGFAITNSDLLASQKINTVPANSYQCAIKNWLDCIPKIELPATFEDALFSLLSSSAQSVFATVKANSVYRKDYTLNIKEGGTDFSCADDKKYNFEICVKSNECSKFMLSLSGVFADTLSTAVLTIGNNEYYLPQSGLLIVSGYLETGDYECSLQVFGAHYFKSKKYSTSTLTTDYFPLVGTIDSGIDFEAVCISAQTEIANAMLCRIRATMLSDCNMSIRSNASQRAAEIAIEKQSKADESLKLYKESTSLIIESLKRLEAFNKSNQPTVHTL